ncbi:hypothetical protein [Streptomyces sp. NPDC059247]|uniref:hypothetical protein n=1 Tax=Streptomyces sp. NPDC059247 TaxID=3346790 RepID=UPI003678E2CD
MADDGIVEVNPLFTRPGERAVADRFRIPDGSMLDDIRHAVRFLDGLGGPMPSEGPVSGFHH